MAELSLPGLPGSDLVWIENRAAGLGLVEAARDLWDARELVAFFVWRDLKVRYKQATFGLAWVIIQPIVGMAALTFIFHEIGHVSSGSVPYVPSTLLGYACWTYVASTVTVMTSSFLVNAPLLTKVYFPRLALPVGASLPGLVDLAGGLIVVAAFMIGYAVVPTAALVTLPLWIIGLALSAFSVGTLLATLNVQFRDVGQIVGMLVQLWFFVSPVAYASSSVHGALAWVYHINPVAGALDGFRWALLDGPPPGATCLASLATAAVLLAGSTAYFLRVERRFADIV